MDQGQWSKIHIKLQVYLNPWISYSKKQRGLLCKENVTLCDDDMQKKDLEVCLSIHKQI